MPQCKEWRFPNRQDQGRTLYDRPPAVANRRSLFAARSARAVILLDRAHGASASSKSVQLLMKRHHFAAFTLIEMLVVIAIIAVLAAFAVPALTQALTRGQLTGTMNNARQLYLATFQMATDGSTNSDTNLTWPGDDTALTASASLRLFCEKLVQNDYLKAGDLQKILTAPGANCTVTTDAATPPAVSLAGTSALKIHKIREVDPANTVFAVSSNYVYAATPTATAAPYGDKGFVVIRKGGDASTFRKNQSTVANYGNDARRFQSTVGKLTGDDDGSVGTESGRILTQP